MHAVPQQIRGTERLGGGYHQPMVAAPKLQVRDDSLNCI